MSRELSLRNRQRARAIDLRLLRDLIQDLLAEIETDDDSDLTVHLLDARAMTRLNAAHMRHQGSTDVITLDYSDAGPSKPLVGEIFVCVDEALTQARRFRTNWRAELVRYIIHGLLHLRGHDDLRPAARRRMKREEARLLKKIARRFCLSNLERKSTLAA
jgi:probable rRNA maturation factor